jgi:glyoxylase-like metal-dependent hydrolase (beta-lactamase superfamily II)/rhodanese-related sulfurtransferase
VIFEQFYLDCLSVASYLVGDETTGRAVVVDPQRDVSGYLREADARGLKIELVVETHVHADFLSGHLELAARTGATIAYGDAADVDFPVRHLHDGERIGLGAVTLEVRATPGHTPESISVIVFEHRDDTVPYGVLTGDALFIGDVGRPDLLAAAGTGLTPDVMARALYRSLHERLLALPDATRVFPAHGAGSACGKQMSTARTSTIGEQRATNYALAPMSEERFVEILMEGQSPPPGYFAYDASRNRANRALLDETEPVTALSLDEVLALGRDGAALLDTREPIDFAAGHLRGAVDVGLQGRFAEYAGDVLTPDRPIVLVGDPATAVEAKVRLARIGFDDVAGYLADPGTTTETRPELLERSSRLTVAELDERRSRLTDLVVLDVRSPSETDAGVIPGSRTVPLTRVVTEAAALDPDAPVAVYCASGYRSMIAASALEAAGFHDVSDLLGGYDAWSAVHGAEP